MKIGLVGLGKMGKNIAENLRDHGHEIICFDIAPASRQEAMDRGFTVFDTLEALVSNLSERKVIWLMVPCGSATNETILNLIPLLKAGDILIDGGNSNYKDSIAHAQMCRQAGEFFIDLGTSGGIEGARHGACLMAGGEKEPCAYMESVFMDAAVAGGYIYAGKSGAGHFMKMVHNGIEYGMMQAIGEGFHVLEQSEFEYDFEKVASNWNHGSVIRGWLMELMEEQFSKHPDLNDICGIVDANGEAKWMVQAALEEEVPVPVTALSLMIRNASQQKDSFSNKVIAALRNGFGGHAVREKKDV